MKTSELTGAALDWAVMNIIYPLNSFEFFVQRHSGGKFQYSSDWSQGGPVIERERIELKPTYAGWTAFIGHDVFANGHIPLIAAMRCYVTSKLGKEIEVPEELQ